MRNRNVFRLTGLLLMALAGCSRIYKAPPTFEIVASNVSGSVVYSRIISHEPFVSQIFLKNLDTGEVKQLTNPGKYSWPRWSPNGSQILFLLWTEENSGDIYLMNRDGSNQRPIVTNTADETMPDWSPNGDKIVFVSNRDGNDEIYSLDLNTETIIRLTNNPTGDTSPKWSSDGKSIAFISVAQHGRPQMLVMNADGTESEPLTEYDLSNFDGSPVWCPDNSCIVFTRYVNGVPKLMLLNLLNGDVHQLLGGIFAPDLPETRLASSPSRGYMTFSVGGTFYAMDVEKMKIYPLGVEALDLSLYP